MSRKGMDFTEDDDDFVVTPRTKHRFNLNGTPNIKISSCSPSSGRLLGNTQRTPTVFSVQTLGPSSLSKGVNGNGKVYRMVQNIQHSMTAQGNRSQVHRTSNDEAVSKAGIKEGVWLNTSPKKNQQSNSYLPSGSQSPSISQTSELKANSAQVKPNKSKDTVSSSCGISKLSLSSVDKSLVGISRPSFAKTNKPFSLYTFPKSPQKTLDCKADKLPPEDDVVETPATSTVKTNFNAANRVALTQKHRQVEEILKSIDGKRTASRNDITSKRSYGNSVSESDWLDNKVKKVRSNYKCMEPVVQLCNIDSVMNLNTAWPGQDEKSDGKRALSDSEWSSDQSDIVIAETPLSKNRKRVQKIESDSDESEELFDSKQSGMSDSSHVEFLSIKNSQPGKSDISESEISDSTHMDIDSLSNCTIEEILSSSDEQVNTTVSTDNDPESSVPVNKQRTRPNFVLDKFGTESSSESDCPTSHSLVGRYSKIGKERDNHRTTESGHMGFYTFPINKESKLYNSSPRTKSEKSHAVEKNRKISAEKPFGSGMEKRKYGNQRLKRRLSLSPDSGELPTISRPKQRRVCKLKSSITLDETISSSDSETLDGERSWVVSGVEQNIPNAKISDTSVLETFSDPDVDTSGTGEFLTLVESPTVLPCEQFPSKDTGDVQILSLSTSEDSDVPLMELLERRKEKKPLTTSKLSDKSGEKSIKFGVTSVKQEIVSLGYLEKTLPSTSVIDEQSKDVNDRNETLFRDTIDSDEQDKLRKRKNHSLMDKLKIIVKISEDENEDDDNTISFQDTEDSIEEDKQKNRQIHSLLEKLKETIKSVKKDKLLASASPSPPRVSLSPSLHQNTGKTVEHFGNEMNENDKNDIHEKTIQLQNMEINTLDIPVLVNNKKHVGADVSVKTEPISSYTQEPECIFIDDDDDIDDEFLRSLSQRVDYFDVDDGDKEGEEETKQCYADDEGTVEDVNVKVEMDSEGFEIKDPEYWEDYAQMSEQDSDGYGNLSEPSLMERSALGTVKKIKTEMDMPKGDGEKVSAGRNALSSKENNHSLVVKTEIHSDVELDSTIEEDNSGHDKQEDDGLIGASFLSEDDDVLYAAATQVDSDLASKAGTILCRTVKLERNDEDVCSGKSVSKISKEEMDSDDDIYLAETQLDVQELRKDSLGHRSLQVIDDKTDPYLVMTQVNCITAKGIKGMEMFNDSYLTPAVAPARKNLVSSSRKHQQDQVKDWMDGSISREDPVSFYSEMTQVDSQDKQRLEVSRADDIDALHEAYMEQTQIKFCKTTKSTSHMVRDPENDEIEDDSVYNAQTHVDPSLSWKPQESRNSKDQIEYPGTKEKTRFLAEVLKDSHAGTPKAVDKTLKRVSVSSGENVSKQISPLLSHATDLGLNSAHTFQTEVSVAKSVSVRRHSQKNSAQRRTLEIEPQRKKSTKEMRMEFKAANFYPSKHQDEWSSGAAEMYLEETSDSRSNWLSKNSKITPEKSKPVQEKKISYKDTAIKKSKDRKRRKSLKKPAFSLTQAIQDAKCRLVDRNFQTVVRPESLAEGYKKKLATVASEDVEDVELPTDSQIMNQGLPLLCPKNPLLTSRKKSPSSGPHIATSSHSLESVRTSPSTLVTSNRMVTMANSSTVSLSSVSSVNSLSVVTTSVNNSCPLSAGGTVTTVSTTYREPLLSTSRKSVAVSSSSFDREKVVISTGRSSNPTSRQSSVEDVIKSPGLHEKQTDFLAIGSPAMDLVSSILAQSKSDVPHFKLSNSSHGSNVTEKSLLGSSVMNKIDVKRGSRETNVKHKEKDAQKVKGACVNMAEKNKDVTKKSRDSRVHSLSENIKPKGINGRMSNKDHHQRRHTVETSIPRVGDGRELSQPLKVEIDDGKRKGSDEGMTNRDNHKRRHSVETSCLKAGDSREVSQSVRIQIEKKPKGSDEGLSNRDCHKGSHSVEMSMHKVGDSREASQPVNLQKDKGKHNDTDRKMSGRDHHNRRHSVETSRHKAGDGKWVNQPERIQIDEGNKPVNAVAPMQINNLLSDLEKVAMVTESTSQSELLNRAASPLPDQQRQLSTNGVRQNEGHSAAQVENCTKGKISTVTTIKKEAQNNSSALYIERQHQVHSVALMQNLTEGTGTTVNHSVSEVADPTSTFQRGAQTNATSLFNGQEQQDKLNNIGEIPLSDDQKKFENSEPDVSATTAVEVSVIDNMKAGLSVQAETNFVVGRVYELKADSVADAVPTGSILNRLLPGKMFTSPGLVSQQFDQQLSFYGGHVQTSRDSRKVARQNSNDPSRHADTKHNPSLASFRATGPAAQQVASSSSNLMRLDCQTKLPQLDDFLIFLLKWNPVWLNEQKDKLTKENRPAEPPPVAGEQRPFPLVEKYSSFDEYCNMFMVPLLLYEAWECCFRDWKTRKDHKNTICHKMYQGGYLIDKEHQRSSCKIVEYVGHTLITREDWNIGRYINEGDLVWLNIFGVMTYDNKNKSSQPDWFPQMAYVDSISIKTDGRSVLRVLKMIPHEGRKRPDMYVYMKFVFRIRWRKFRPVHEQPSEVHQISSIITTIRQYQALSLLPRSPLCQDILYPTCSLTFLDKETYVDPSLKVHYNSSQAEAIATITKMVLSPYVFPKICLLQGPPGTGKSYTIIALIKKIMKDTNGNAKICVCAPSNAAVDVLMKRLVEYNRTRPDKTSALRCVRIGKLNTMHPDVQSYSFIKLLEKNVESLKLEKRKKKLPKSLINQHLTLLEKISVKKTELKSSSGDSLKIARIKSDLKTLEKDKKRIENQMDAQADVRLSPEEESNLRRNILLKANIIAGTLCGLGASVMNNITKKDDKEAFFKCIIVDEATQATELDCLIPLQYGSSKLVLVGDPEQLPPTVVSQVAAENKFGQSLFERFYNHFKYTPNNPVMMLNTQYRMDLEICSFPNSYIYERKIQTDLTVRNRSQRFDLEPYLVFDVCDGHELQSQSGSVSNLIEAEFTVKLCKFVLQTQKMKPCDIGIIAPYQNQKKLLHDLLGKSNIRGVEVGTVDGFQGREKSVIIMSCVRAKNPTGTIGFVGSRQRMNVALTRAKYACYIVGHIESLQTNEEWRALINDAKERQRIIPVKSNHDAVITLQRCRKTKTKGKSDIS